jgi:hypothetical protein
MGKNKCSCKNEKQSLLENPDDKQILKKNPDDTTIFRSLDKTIYYYVKDVLRDDFIIELSNYLSNNEMFAEAKVVLNRIDGTRYPVYRFTGLLDEEKVDKIPITVNLNENFSYVMTGIDWTYDKNGELKLLSKEVIFALKKFLCRKIVGTIRKKQIQYLQNKSTESSIYKVSLEEILGRKIGYVIDELSDLLDPLNPTVGCVKYLNLFQLKIVVPVNPAVKPQYDLRYTVCGKNQTGCNLDDCDDCNGDCTCNNECPGN